jgi:hypothetical protein
MASSIQAFNIQTLGSWPTETYQISPLDQYIDPNAGFLPAENMFRYLNVAMNETDSLHTVNYYGINYKFSDPPISQYVIDTSRNSSLVWDLSSHRKAYNFGPQINYLYILSNPGVDSLYQKYYATLTYPSRLFLKPLNLRKNASSWTLTTSSVLVSAQSFFFSGSSHEIASYLQHISYLNSPPTFIPLPNDIKNNFVFELSSCRMQVNTPLVMFTDTFNPAKASRTLDRLGGVIRPDSTFITYNINYYNKQNNKITSLSQVTPDVDHLAPHGFKTSYILNQSELSSSSLQKYQLLQYKPFDNVTDNLASPFLCILSAVFNLTSTNLQYFNLQFARDNYTLYTASTGTPGSIIGASYIVDSDRMLFSTETSQSTLSSFQINGISKNLGIPVNYAYLTNNSSWTTKYPPHYYSYKNSLYSPLNGFSNNKSDTCNLTFYLQTSVVNLQTTSALLSSFISSDHNILSYNLPDNNVNEYIKYELISDNSLIRNTQSLSAINFYYGSSTFSSPYNIISSPWVSVTSGCQLYIDYPGAPYGQTSLTIRSTLSSAAGYLASRQVAEVSLAPGIFQSAVGHPIFLDRVDQGPDYFDVSCSMLTASPGWPTKDLRDSYISWSFTPQDLNAQLLSINSAGSVLLNLSANQPYRFSDFTNSVRLSGIGFSTAVIYLSSQKYNQVTSLTSISSLYDPFYLKQFVINPQIPLANENKTRTITLFAQLPFANQLYDIPLGTSVFWEWDYLTNTAPTRGPINVYYGPLKTPYTYGQEMDITSLSSIYIEITPQENDNIPILNHARFRLSSKIRNPQISSIYEVVVDDFPARSIFNSDFKIGYTNYQQTEGIILDTGLNNFTVTRPNDGTNVFSLSSYANSHISPNTTYVWTISDDANTLSSQKILYSNHVINYDINPRASVTTITLSALSAVLTPWFNLNITGNTEFSNTNPVHSVETSVTVFTPTTADFYKPLEFIIYPEYAWLGGRNLTILNQSNYTLSKAPSAYQHKKSNSQTYWISANKFFNQYDYCIGSNYLFLSSLSSNIGIIDIPYSTEMFDISGLTISLSGFSDLYPPNHTISYFKPDKDFLKSFNFYITAATSVLSGNSYLNSFKSNPFIVPYNTDIDFTFSLAKTSLDLNYNRTITITQHFSAKPYNSPVRPLTEFGTVTYLLSTNFWSKEITLPSIDGTFNALYLKTGDPYEEGYVSDSQTNYLAFKPLFSKMFYQIPSSTFDNYSITDYEGQRDLWNKDTQITYFPTSNTGPYKWQTLVTHVTGLKPLIFVSDYIALTGQEIYIQYSMPDELKEHYHNVAYYATDFGETGSTYILPTTSLPYQLSKYQYSSTGSFFIQYSAFYTDGALKTGELLDPITIKPYWTQYDQSVIRTIDENSLIFPYSLEQTTIQPNEWGDVDIFNTSVSRLYNNLQYLQDNIQTINSDTPTLLYGWLGGNVYTKSQGIRWFVRNFDPKYYLFPNYASTTNSVSAFYNIEDIAINNDYIYVLDNYKLRCFYNKSYKPIETFFDLSSSWNLEMVAPNSLDIDLETSDLFIVDPPRNKIVRLNVDLQTPAINFSVNVGGFGSRLDSSKFNAPSQVVVANNSVFVLDYNNKCVKEYTKDLNWMHTYYHPDFETNSPISIASNQTGLVYIATSTFKIYIFSDANPSTPVVNFTLTEMQNLNIKIVKIILDKFGGFLYVNGIKKTFKYTSTPIKTNNNSYVGVFIGIMNLNFSSSSIKNGSNQNLFLSTKNAIIRVQDIVALFKIGKGLPYSNWTQEQLLLNKQEFASDLNYNKCLQRLVQNVKTFRNNLNAKFVKSLKKTAVGDVSYFAMAPISVSDLPVFEDDVENELVNIGVNELHIPQVFNREISKIYRSLDLLRNFLNISQISEPTTQTIQESFCWSWKATSCYNLTLPSIKVLDVNPITYTELKADFPVDYAPSKYWKDAQSNCCS